MKQLHRFLTTLLLVTGLVPYAHGVPPPTCETAGEPCSAHLPKSGPGDPICLQSSPIDDPRTKYVCASGTVTLTVTRGDQDAYGDPIACDAALPKLSWSDTAGGSAGNQWSYTFQAPVTPGSYTVTCTAEDGEDDPGQPGYDEPEYIEWTIVVVKVSMTNPHGDPIVSAQAMDGANEFTFSAGVPGVCDIECTATITPFNAATLAWAEQNVSWSISPGIPGSTLSWLNGDYSVGDNKGLHVILRFTGLPINNSDFGDKTITLSACSQTQNSPIQVFFTKNATNHPGGQVGSPNWFHYWKQVYSLGNQFLYDGPGVPGQFGQVKGMAEWSYATQPDKVGRYLYDASSLVRPALVQISAGPWDGIDCFINECLHENQHVVQIASADAIVGTPAGTCWRYGWSWNQGDSHNHYAVGADGQPGKASEDDDSDSSIDNHRTDRRGEMGWPLSDDTPLYAAWWTEWPLVWGEPPSPPWERDNPIEHQAYQCMTVLDETNWEMDWGSPGKQHRTNHDHSN